METEGEAPDPATPQPEQPRFDNIKDSEGRVADIGAAQVSAKAENIRKDTISISNNVIGETNERLRSIETGGDDYERRHGAPKLQTKLKNATHNLEGAQRALDYVGDSAIGYEVGKRLSETILGENFLSVASDFEKEDIETLVNTQPEIQQEISKASDQLKAEGFYGIALRKALYDLEEKLTVKHIEQRASTLLEKSGLSQETQEMATKSVTENVRRSYNIFRSRNMLEGLGLLEVKKDKRDEQRERLFIVDNELDKKIQSVQELYDTAFPEGVSIYKAFYTTGTPEDQVQSLAGFKDYLINGHVAQKAVSEARTQAEESGSALSVEQTEEISGLAIYAFKNLLSKTRDFHPRRLLEGE